MTTLFGCIGQGDRVLNQQIFDIRLICWKWSKQLRNIDKIGYISVKLVDFAPMMIIVYAQSGRTRLPWCIGRISS